MSTRVDGRPTRARDSEGRRRSLAAEERTAFWAWACIEISRQEKLAQLDAQQERKDSPVFLEIPTLDQFIA
ncbi:hypothetical protein [Nocardia sp. CNY236]|uniref:hypothetical protein n=1 Tax=Nocardia sp. CNY236 TaxID=1169152 RepID=UPI000418B508|nr:hypothetical protein [Nocardia sp. CNY236]